VIRIGFRLKDSIPLRGAARAACGKMTDSGGRFFHCDRIRHPPAHGRKRLPAPPAAPPDAETIKKKSLFAPKRPCGGVAIATTQKDLAAARAAGDVAHGLI